MRSSDTVTRQRGDEFVIMLLDLSDMAPEAARQIESLGAQMLAALNRRYRLAGHVHHNSASIGVTVFDGMLDSSDAQLKRADLAMYQAKAGGRKTLRFFEADMRTAVSARAALKADLRIGLQQGQFVMYYQARIDAAGAVSGAEVLLRGVTSRAELIAVAEESGLILPLGC